MKIESFGSLIRELPYKNQSFDTKIKNWICKDQAELIKSIFANSDEITLNRFDLMNSHWNLDEFVLKTLMWGYPTKGRGRNIDTLLEESNFKELVRVLQLYEENEITLKQFKEDTKKIPGLGLSTMSKFAYFLKTRINGNRALILDRRIIETVGKGRFEELNHLKGLRYDNSFMKYCEYLETIHQIAEKIKVESDQVEYFIFTFGRNLSEVKGEECYDID